MVRKGRQKNRMPSVPIAADSGPTILENSSSSEADDDPIKNSTSNRPKDASFDWETCTKEEQLEKIIRKKLDHLFREALSRLVCKGFDQDVALNGLLERGYCVGDCDCLTSVVENCLEFLTGKEVESEEQDQPQPFQNLHLLVEFNLRFMVYVLQKHRPSLNRLCICRYILMTDLNLNRAIIMNIKHTPFDITDMPSDLNLDEADVVNGEKNEFLALEVIEMLVNLNFLDKFITEDMKEELNAAMQNPIHDLKPRLEERIRWANKKLAQARRKQPSTIMSIGEELRVYHYFAESMLAKRESELSLLKIEFHNTRKTGKLLGIEQEEIKSEISASKLIESEMKQKLLEVSKKGQLKNSEKQKAELQEEIELEKTNLSKLKQELVDNEAAICQIEVKFWEVARARKAAVEQVYKEYRMALDNWKRMVNARKAWTNEERFILMVHMARHKKLINNSLDRVKYELIA